MTVDCPTCHGTGWVSAGWVGTPPDPSMTEVGCPDCGGTGQQCVYVVFRDYSDCNVFVVPVLGVFSSQVIAEKYQDQYERKSGHSCHVDVWEVDEEGLVDDG